MDKVISYKLLVGGDKYLVELVKLRKLTRTP